MADPPRISFARCLHARDRIRPSAEDEADLRAGLAELDRGEGVELTADELRHLEETGEWPERLD